MESYYQPDNFEISEYLQQIQVLRNRLQEFQESNKLFEEYISELKNEQQQYDIETTSQRRKLDLLKQEIEEKKQILFELNN
ncbi:coiled-coil protein [Entamoeba histolytica]|uniref:Coiled-coil protein n=2 Tax=Entamoeba histolytica TaxID=5759 RepID=A0A175JW12_ENTHI|nr:coiled-coil protein [Entamoeba histolytica]